MFWLLLAFTTVVSALGTRQSDPCAKIAGQKWSATQDVRACFQHFPLNETIKENILQVIEKSMAFHTSTNYQIQAPAPFEDTKIDILAELGRIRGKKYNTDFEFHVELARTVRQLNDGHGVYVNMCYDSTWTSYLPIPLVLLEGSNEEEALHIAPEAFIVASSEFSNQLDVWRSALPEAISLESLSGAKVLSINNGDPFAAMDAAASVAGSYQAFSARQNGFTASYTIRGEKTWVYILGSFAQSPLPLTDSVTLSIQRVGSTAPVTITLPYRSRFGKDSFAFTDASSFWANNCLAKPGTNGFSHYNSAAAKLAAPSVTTRRFRSVTKTNSTERLPLINEILDVSTASDIPMPEALYPPFGIHSSNRAVIFQMLPDQTTGLIALGSFNSGGTELSYYVGFENGLSTLKYGGAKRVIIDLSNNSGGSLCAAAYLHRIISGRKSVTEPQALLPTTLRAGPLAKKIVNKISQGGDPKKLLRYNPSQSKFANHTAFPDGYDFLADPVAKTVNGRSDAFSQTLGQECQPFGYLTPDPAPYIINATEIVILTNGRCASSCALFVIAMQKLEGVKVVAIGGRKSVRQDYAGTVGGQSLSFADIDTEIKSLGLKSEPAAPPDFITNSYQGITYRLAYGVENPAEPEEWQARNPTLRIPLTADIVNRPLKIYEKVVAQVFN